MCVCVFLIHIVYQLISFLLFYACYPSSPMFYKLLFSLCYIPFFTKCIFLRFRFSLLYLSWSCLLNNLNNGYCSFLCETCIFLCIDLRLLVSVYNAASPTFLLCFQVIHPSPFHIFLFNMCRFYSSHSVLISPLNFCVTTPLFYICLFCLLAPLFCVL